MKKLLICSFLVALLAGCDLLIDSDESVVSNGVIMKIDMSSWQYGSHILNDKDGKPLYALKCSKIDLNNFNDKVVYISGERIKGYPVDGGPIYVEVTGIKIMQ